MFLLADEVLQAKTLQEYDEKFNLKLGKFKSLDEYYEAAGCVDYIPKVKIPTLFINSLEDPVIE